MKKELAIWAIKNRKTGKLEYDFFKSKQSAEEWIMGIEDDYEVVKAVVKESK